MEPKIERIQTQDPYEEGAQMYARELTGSSAIAHLFKTRLMRVYEMLGKVEGMKFLDIGCGSGFMASYILENRGRYFGIDRSKAMLKECQKRLGEEECSPLSLATMANLPFRMPLLMERFVWGTRVRGRFGLGCGRTFKSFER